MRRVLVVDDEPLIRKTISRLLSRHGYSVVVAADGNEALREANELPFDVALVDYEMPGRNGLKVLSELRERQPACIRVLMTGRRDFPLVVAAVNRGEIMRVVQKPFEPQDLVELLDDAYASRLRWVDVQKIQERAVHKLERAMFEQCLSGGYLRLALQPIVYTDGRPFGYEALLRSSHPVLDGPLSVLNVAEKAGMLNELGRVVSERAAELLPSLAPESQLFLNLHPDQLSDPRLLSHTLAPVLPHAHRCTIEITERKPLTECPDWEQVVEQLQIAGFKIAVDDLGSGYNSLGILADLQPTYIKVDMGIVRDVDREPRKQRLVDLLAKFADATAAQLLAEGVETAEEAECLRGCGAHLFQGYFFGKPRIWTPGEREDEREKKAA